MTEHSSDTPQSGRSGNLSKAERIRFIDQRLQTLYPKPPVPLDHKDPYTLLIAVLLSAQCTDERVNQVTPALFKLADNAADMAQVAVDDTQAIGRPCGLAPQKSDAIEGLRESVVED